MLFKMPKITFFSRSNNDIHRTYVLYCRISFNGSKAEFSLKEKIDPGKWDQHSQTYHGSKKQAHFINTLIDTVKYKLKTLSLTNEDLSARELIKLLSPDTKTAIMADIVKNYITSVEHKVSPGTLKNHNIKMNNLIRYQEYLKKNLTVSEFNLVEAEKFKAWYQEVKKTSNIDTANRNILLFRSALIWAQKKGIITLNELVHYQGEKDPVKKPVFLTLEEVNKIRHRSFSSKMLSQIRDLFLFQCYTGLSYSDLWNNWILKQTEHGQILYGTRFKNDQSFFVPVNEVVSSIIEKYEGKLPHYCNAVYNRILKEIAVLCEIDKTICTHTARKTFATLKDSEGWTRETVSRMLGHKSVKTTEIYYLGESFSRIENEMIKRNA